MPVFTNCGSVTIVLGFSNLQTEMYSHTKIEQRSRISNRSNHRPADTYRPGLYSSNLTNMLTFFLSKDPVKLSSKLENFDLQSWQLRRRHGCPFFVLSQLLVLICLYFIHFLIVRLQWSLILNVLVFVLLPALFLAPVYFYLLCCAVFSGLLRL